MRLPQIGDTWFHVKSNKLYRIESICRAEQEPDTILVTYVSVEDDLMAWARTLEDFMDLTDDGPRFRFRAEADQ